MAVTKIEWCKYTFNPWVGCQRVSPGCTNCYAESWARRTGNDVWANSPRRRTAGANWNRVRRWDAIEGQAQKTHGAARERVFCASLADVFEDNAQVAPWRQELWKLIAECPHLDWLLLTKRPENVRHLVPSPWLAGHWPQHVWIGTTVEDQRRAEERLPHLLALPAPLRFVSYEPALEPVGWWRWVAGADWEAIDWLIVGGESGPGARPFHLNWAADAVRDCRLAGVPVFVKQLGAQPVGGPALVHPKGGDPAEWPEALRVRQVPPSPAASGEG